MRTKILTFVLFAVGVSFACASSINVMCCFKNSAVTHVIRLYYVASCRYALDRNLQKLKLHLVSLCLNQR